MGKTEADFLYTTFNIPGEAAGDPSTIALKNSLPCLAEIHRGCSNSSNSNDERQTTFSNGSSRWQWHLQTTCQQDVQVNHFLSVTVMSSLFFISQQIKRF